MTKYLKLYDRTVFRKDMCDSVPRGFVFALSLTTKLERTPFEQNLHLKLRPDFCRNLKDKIVILVNINSNHESVQTMVSVIYFHRRNRTLVHRNMHGLVSKIILDMGFKY